MHWSVGETCVSPPNILIDGSVTTGDISIAALESDPETHLHIASSTGSD